MRRWRRLLHRRVLITVKSLRDEIRDSHYEERAGPCIAVLNVYWPGDFPNIRAS